MNKFKNLIYVAILVFIFVEVLIVSPAVIERQKKSEKPPEVTKVKKKSKEDDISSLERAGQAMKGLHLVESQKGNRDWELFAEAAEGSQNSGTWNLKKVKVQFYNRDKIEFIVKGDSGTIDTKSKDLSVKGRVETRSENGYRFQTSAIFYHSKDRKIASPEQVHMEGPKDANGTGLDVKGSSMILLVDDSKMFIQKRVTATKSMSDGKKFEVMAGGAEFSGQSWEAKFIDSVIILFDNFKLEGPEATFNYKAGLNILGSISLKGGVRVSDVDKSATSENVLLDLLENKYIFRGHPKVEQNNDELSGEEITFLEGGKKVKVERVRAKMENNKR